MLKRLANWLLALCGQAQAVPELPTHRRLTRDKYGRFRPKDAPPPGADPQADFLEANRVTPRMQAAALADYAPPDDPHNIDQVERRLREYIVANLGTWVNGRHCSLWMAFAALKDTYAIDQKHYTTLLAAARAALPARAVSTGASSPQRALVYPAPIPDHGARASCPPLTVANNVFSSAEPEVAPTIDQRLTTIDSPLGHSELASEKRAECPRSEPFGDTLHSITVRPYDPDYDVVANLSQKTKGALCPEGFYQGFGNDAQQAIESYYAKNRGEMRSYGGDWETYGEGCKVYEQFDKQQRKYYVARVDGNVDRKEQEASLFGAADCQSAYSPESCVVGHESSSVRSRDSGLTTHDSGPAADPSPAFPPPLYVLEPP